ncbi:MAG: hypothetical protein ACYS8Z_16740, partial [Planctomycetota bacterium]
GFTITAGNANGTFTAYSGFGGGMLNSSRDTDCSPTVTECTFIANSAIELGGGGMCNYGHGDGECNPIITKCVFLANAAETGGGMGNWESSPAVTDCKFIANFADEVGGGMANSSFGPPVGSCPILINCIFVANYTTHSGGGMFNMEFSSPILVNCSFTGNSAEDEGGGIYNVMESNPTVTNSILWNNSDAGGTDESAQIDSFDSTPVVNYSCIQGWTGALGGTGNIGDDPLFRDPDGPDNILGTSDDDLRLDVGSPCIERGDSAAIPAGVLTDLADEPRIIDAYCDYRVAVDMGAYEFSYAYIGDFNYDCDIDFKDYAIFAPAWLTEPADPEWNPTCNIGIPKDTKINARDLKIFAENWLATAN